MHAMEACRSGSTELPPIGSLREVLKVVLNTLHIISFAHYILSKTLTR
jgi:hypothetical protein